MESQQITYSTVMKQILQMIPVQNMWELGEGEKELNENPSTQRLALV